MKVHIGQEFINPVTGERAIIRIPPSKENKQTLIVDLFIGPGGAVSGEHIHPSLEEAFTVLRGQVGMRLNGQGLIAPLNERIVIPVGVVHDWWNAGDEEAHVQVEVMPGDRFLEMASNLFGFARDGKTNKKGMPNLLQLIVFGKEFEDVIIFSKPPRWVFSLMYALLSPFARILGYQGSYQKYLE
jgi:quercetin dioxygenase-like cupin family protein